MQSLMELSNGAVENSKEKNAQKFATNESLLVKTSNNEKKKKSASTYIKCSDKF